MAACWWCYWGWPKQIHDIYQEAVESLGGDSSALDFGPAHIVWSDENWDMAQWCLDNFTKYSRGYSEEEMEVVRWSLEELVKVDDRYKKVPEGYDEENPERFPPPDDWVMVKEGVYGQVVTEWNWTSEDAGVPRSSAGDGEAEAEAVCR